ncbi:pyridoxal phosphate-dependent aminotransferase [Limnochorda pilosa]|uniref:Aminotransferase class I/II n=1 Tax=Limnochorda pilosa TaxID=1555112 RepID=A0A0K2SL56_LIMPI|nr:aminotransferase class I/II-fold pyridoxal phosphate-dependent enzyme [Limnochorda pilosa]BAS27848.1 aminotransferase class I/II [Limnochorda pilosa]
MASYAERATELPRSGIRLIMDAADRIGEGIMHLEVGQPHFPTAPHIVEAGAKALRDGYTRYTPNVGMRDVREALAAYCQATYPEWTVRPENVILTVGGVFGVAVALGAIVRQGHSVLIPDPGWPNYTAQALYIGAEPIPYPLRVEKGYEPEIDELEGLVTPETDAIIINSPGNPTGAALRPEKLEELAAFARRHDLFVVSDEVYDHITYDGDHTPMAYTSIPPEQLITVNSLSKTYCMTGWRVGYSVVPGPLVDLFTKVSETLVSCPPAVSQRAAKAAVEGPQDSIAAMVAYYKANRDLIVAELQKAAIPVTHPAGAFYMLVDISACGVEAREFALKLLSEERVAVAPGDTFGSLAESHIRISFCTDRSTVAEGVAGLVRLIDRLR